MNARRKKGINPLVLIFIIALVAVCVTIVVLLALGYRYKSTDKGYTFFGKVQSGQPVTGTIKLPGGVTAEPSVSASAASSRRIRPPCTRLI